MKQIDFLPRTFHQAMYRRRQVRRNVAYCLAVALGLGALHLGAVSRLRSAQAGLAELRTRTVDLQAQQQRLAGLQQARQELQRQVSVIESLDDDAPVDAIIAEITALLSDSMTLRSLALETVKDNEAVADAAPGSPGSARGARIVLRAVAASDIDVGIFFGRLSSCPLLSDVTMSFSRQSETTGRAAREFEMKFTVKRVLVTPLKGAQP